MVSPLSVFLALAMTVNGADSDTRDDMLKVLTDGALTVDQVNEVSRNLIGLLEKSEPKTQVSIANSIWFRQVSNRSSLSCRPMPTITAPAPAASIFPATAQPRRSTAGSNRRRWA
jgi:hypothetical protein